MSYLILYASVTGNAESLASLIAEESEKRNLKFTKKCMSDTKNIDLSKQNCLIIISSTTGDGEQPESALPFLKKLRSKEIREKGLKHLSYTILGLGDSNYSQFCNGPKDIHKKLLLLGAKTFYEPGWADDGVGLEIVVEPWIEKIWTLLAKYKTGEMPMNGIGTDVTKPNVDLNFTKSESLKRDVPFLKEQFDKKLMNNTMEELVEQLGGVSIKVNLNDPLKDPALPSDTNLLLPSSPSHFLRLSYLDASDEKSINIPEELSHLQDKKLLECTLKNAKKLSKTGSVKDCYQVTLEFAQENGKTLAPDLEPGDAVDIICSNPRKEVDTLLKRLGLLNELADKACTSASLIPDCKKSAKIPIYLPKNGKLFSLRHILSNSVEIHSVPKKPFIRMLVDFTSDPLERRRLEELCSRQGGNNYLSVIRGNNICLLDLLLGFPSCQPPIGTIKKFILLPLINDNART
jgi:methionine synthase reductase